MNRERGFTLLELAVGLVLLALLSALTAISLRAGMDTRRIDDAVARISALDRELRLRAEHMAERQQLVLRTTDGTLTAKRSGGGKSTGRVRLSGGLELSRLVVQGSTGRTRGTFEIEYSRDGSTPSYAFEIQDSAGETRACLVVGRSGQVTRLEDFEAAREIVAAHTRPDLDRGPRRDLPPR